MSPHINSGVLMSWWRRDAAYACCLFIFTTPLTVRARLYPACHYVPMADGSVSKRCAFSVWSSVVFIYLYVYSYHRSSVIVDVIWSVQKAPPPPSLPVHPIISTIECYLNCPRVKVNNLIMINSFMPHTWSVSVEQSLGLCYWLSSSWLASCCAKVNLKEDTRVFLFTVNSQ